MSVETLGTCSLGIVFRGIASSPYEQPSRPLHLLKTALRSDCLKRRQCVHSISAGIMVMLTLCIRSFTHPTRHACAMRLVDRTEWRIMGVPALLQHAVRIAPVSLHPPTMLASKEGISVDSVRSIQCSMRRVLSGQLPCCCWHTTVLRCVRQSQCQPANYRQHLKLCKV
jgi:hypothetical protein